MNTYYRNKQKSENVLYYSYVSIEAPENTHLLSLVLKIFFNYPTEKQQSLNICMVI